MNDVEWTPQEEEKLATYLADRVCSKAEGRDEPECLRNFPRDRYFIGNLRPVPNETGEGVEAGPVVAAHLRELINKLSPVAFGAEFRLRPENGQFEVDVKVKWACYYRAFPTLDQQRHHQHLEQQVSQAAAAQTNITEGEVEEDLTETDKDIDIKVNEPLVITQSSRRTRMPSDTLLIRFKKIPCQAQGRVILRRNTLGDGTISWQLDLNHLETVLHQEMLRAQQVVLDDPDRVRTSGAPDDKIRIPDTALGSEEAYAEFLKSLRTDVVPTWAWKVRAEVRSGESVAEPSELLMSLEFTNTSPMAEQSPNTEAFLFDVRATFTFARCHVLPFELELAPRGFRYDRHLWGRGFNCAVDRQDKTQSAPAVFVTTNAPIYPQMRYITRTNPPAPFNGLASNPIPVLENILRAMRDERQIWAQERWRYQQADPNWERDYSAEFDRDYQLFEDELVRFERGLKLIRDNADVRSAFQLTNETFRRGPKTDWRLFQIVFLVSQIHGIAALASSPTGDASEREKVDIIYFPTGGGKTEAYLAVLVFHCFFDRLRGKAAGVTAWTRFPLRLLTVQQTQRVADVIAIAELVRREQTDPRLIQPDVDGFAVGYLVGQEATPNEIIPPRQSQPAEPTWSAAQDVKARQQWKKIVRCPACRTTTVQVDFDRASIRILHRCTQPRCAFPQGIIPVFVIDNEIYRYLPCVVVGTIDKLAALGNQRKMSLLMGQVDGRCSVHGYYKGKCCQKECTDSSRLLPGAPNGISGPSLFVQDELHLLKEGLGTFDSHYETFTQRLLQEFGMDKPLKVIASSGTIEAFERQVEHLYGRPRHNARVFPSPGPTLKRSFYAETYNYPQRLFVGIIPHNKTIFNAVLELIQYYHESVQDLQRLPIGTTNPYGGQVTPGSQQWQKLIDYYITSLSYFLANRELNSIRTDLEAAVNMDLQQAGYRPLNLAELTGSTGSDEVTRTLERLETLLPTPGTAPDTILATSMVSHGVDIDRFNAMIFYGMPRQNAEYIQASSRIGRVRTGIVFMCLHPARERDQSHYAYFTKFHEFLGQLIEPVAINRWSKFSVQRTLPGLFMGILLQLIAHRSGPGNPNRFYMLDVVKKAISDGQIRADGFIPFLEESYQVQGVNAAGPEAFRDEIRVRVQQFLDQILGAGAQQPFVSGALIPPPMNNLREVDEQLEIELDTAGTDWATRTSHP
jgi:hypothetical protein